jgi:hypothetical protein
MRHGHDGGLAAVLCRRLPEERVEGTGAREARMMRRRASPTVPRILAWGCGRADRLLPTPHASVGPQTESAAKARANLVKFQHTMGRPPPSRKSSRAQLPVASGDVAFNDYNVFVYRICGVSSGAKGRHEDDEHGDRGGQSEAGGQESTPSRGP